jgi:FHS family L-fucose permease-like MFS transporter
MAIVGGAALPPLQGLLSDAVSIHVAFIIPLVCFVVTSAYGLAFLVPGTGFSPQTSAETAA